MLLLTDDLMRDDSFYVILKLRISFMPEIVDTVVVRFDKAGLCEL